MVESAKKEIGYFEEVGYDLIEISVKSSNVAVMIEAYRKLADVTDHPLHLGVTEAGPIPQGLVKATAGIATLLAEGIGDTIRYSLTADPVEEAKAGRVLLESMGLRERRGLDLIACPSCGRAEIDVIAVADAAQRALDGLNLPIQVAVMGCVVNGPGEARSADIGIAAGRKRGHLFIKGEVVRVVPEDAMVDELVRLAEVYVKDGPEAALAQADPDGRGRGRSRPRRVARRSRRRRERERRARRADPQARRDVDSGIGSPRSTLGRWAMSWDERFSEDYDVWSARMTADIPFYVELACEADGPLVELAVGTGRVAIPVARATGRRVVGIDSSPSMLALARTAVAEAGVDVDLRQGDMRDFTVDEPAALIYCPYRALLHLPTWADKRRTFERVAASLRPGGRFAWNVIAFDHQYAASHEGVPQTEPVPHTVRYSVGDNRIDLIRDDGAISSLWWATKNEWLGLIDVAGLEVEALYGGFAREPFTPDSREYVFVARRLP